MDRPASPSDSDAPPYAEAPFFKRVQATIDAWLQSEWEHRRSIRNEAAAHGWNEARKAAYDATALTAENLAKAIDNISLAKLRRELNKIGAPAPGRLIREARIEYAKHLLVTGRLLVREVADRAGYEKERQFSNAFMASTGVTPSEFRRLSIVAVTNTNSSEE